MTVRIVVVIAALFVIFFLFIYPSMDTNKKATPAVNMISTKDTAIVGEYPMPSLGYGDEGNTYMVVILDSCEYIYAWFGMANGGGSMTHKGNCKFCAKRK